MKRHQCNCQGHIAKHNTTVCVLSLSMHSFHVHAIHCFDRGHTVVRHRAGKKTRSHAGSHILLVCARQNALAGADADLLRRAWRDEQLRDLPCRAGAQWRVDQHDLALRTDRLPCSSLTGPGDATLRRVSTGYRGEPEAPRVWRIHRGEQAVRTKVSGLKSALCCHSAWFSGDRWCLSIEYVLTPPRSTTWSIARSSEDCCNGSPNNRPS